MVIVILKGVLRIKYIVATLMMNPLKEPYYSPFKAPVTFRPIVTLKGFLRIPPQGLSQELLPKP